MKRSTLFLSIAVMLSVAVAPVALQQTAVAEVDYSVEGGRLTIDFEQEEDLSQFDLYTEFGLQPSQMDGALYFWTLAEQKAILKDKTYNDVDVSVDISTINENGKFDSGIYVQASNVGNAMDACYAWNVNIEHGAQKSTMDLKLHHFDQWVWQGAVVEVMGIPYEGDSMNLRVVVKDGVLSAFLNHRTKPTLTYEIGEGYGQVGLRNFYSPNYFDNFTVTGIGNEVDTSELTEMTNLARSEATKPLAQTCIDELNAAIALAESAQTQVETDEALAALHRALDRAVTARTYTELSALIERSSAFSNPNGAVYTPNSWNSFLAVKQRSQALTEHSSEYDISYWYERLEARIQGLIAYVGEVTE